MPGTAGRSGGHNKGTLTDHTLRGTIRPKRHADLGEPPMVPLGDVVKPARLSARAGAAWDELAPIATAMGTLTIADVSAFSVLCELQGTHYWICELKTSDPAKFSAKLERDYAGILRIYYGLFGFDAASRARLHIPSSLTKHPLDKFLRPRPVSKWAGILK